MRKRFLAMLIAFLPAMAPAADETVLRVVTLKNGNMNGIAHTLQELVPAANVRMSTDGQHIILSGNKETVAGFEEMIKQLDVTPPQNNVEVDVYMIIATPRPSNNPMPATLEPAVAQLKGLFSYKGFRLLDNFVLRSRSGERGESSGFVESGTEGRKITYSFQFARVG